jgi:hypothetical protein
MTESGAAERDPVKSAQVQRIRPSSSTETVIS